LLSFLAIIIATASKKTGTIYTAEEALREASTTYKNINDLNGLYICSRRSYLARFVK
jgi:hypothetical protein